MAETRAAPRSQSPPVPRIGHGFDVHRLVEGRPLVLGGVTIPFHLGLLGHSDADVLVHAVCDAILGAAGLGDIGLHFPDSDEQYRGVSSLVLLAEVLKMVARKGLVLGNIDVTVVAQAPRLRPYVQEIRQRLSKVTGIDTARINVKATTTEGLGYTGRGEAISAHAVVVLMERDG